MAVTKTYQVFSDEKENLHGNTSAVILPDYQLSDLQMQRIAEDFCQPATTFLLSRGTENEYEVRWFAPDSEIDLCGHGSMAAIAFLADYLQSNGPFQLHSRGGVITGEKTKEHTASISINVIPVVRELKIPDSLKDGFGAEIQGYFETANKNIVLLKTEEEVKNLKPDFAALRKSETFAYVVTALGNQVDFVSRTFVPHVRQLEDPATGSAHAVLSPFWAEKTGKSLMQAIQLSSRGGKFHCELSNNTVVLSGEYKLIFEGETII